MMVPCQHVSSLTPRISLLFLALVLGICGTEGQDDKIIIHYEGNRSTGALTPDTDDADWDRTHVFVYPNGQIRQGHLNPAFRKNPRSEKPISILPQTRIIGGLDANQGEVPYQIGIKNPDIGNFCGGTLFNANTVITAAHCFFLGADVVPEEELAEYTFVAGDHDVSYDDGNEQVAKLKELFIHPKYNPAQSLFDIAVVRLRSRYKYNKYVQPLAIGNPPVEGRSGDEAVISGWGYTKARQPGEQRLQAYWPKILKWTSVDLWTKEDCMEAFRDKQTQKMFSYASRDDLICAAKAVMTQNDEIKTYDTCQGDSGGPLACYDPDRGYKKFLCGIVSTGIGCGLPEWPAIYTRVSSHYKWIVEKAGYGDRNTIRF